MALNAGAFALDALHPHFARDLHGRGAAMQIFERLKVVRLFPGREFLFVTISACFRAEDFRRIGRSLGLRNNPTRTEQP
jgi:hypothetical protein